MVSGGTESVVRRVERERLQADDAERRRDWRHDKRDCEQTRGVWARWNRPWNVESAACKVSQRWSACSAAFLAGFIYISFDGVH